jgi:hypothetical protein
VTSGDMVYAWFLAGQPTTLASPDAIAALPADDASHLSTRYLPIMLTTGKIALFVTLFVIGVSLIEAWVLTRTQRNSASPFDWYEVWISLADVAGRKLLALLPLSLRRRSSPLLGITGSLPSRSTAR